MSESSLQKTLYCNRSGVPLATVTLCIVEGATPYMDGFSSTLLLHPFYSLSSVVLTRKLTDYRDWETDRKSTRLNSSH